VGGTMAGAKRVARAALRDALHPRMTQGLPARPRAPSFWCDPEGPSAVPGVVRALHNHQGGTGMNQPATPSWPSSTPIQGSLVGRVALRASASRGRRGRMAARCRGLRAALPGLGDRGAVPPNPTGGARRAHEALREHFPGGGQFGPLWGVRQGPGEGRGAVVPA
jgi:hypothetical protein